MSEVASDDVPSAGLYYGLASTSKRKGILKPTMFSRTIVTEVVSLWAWLMHSAISERDSSVEQAPTVDPGLRGRRTRQWGSTVTALIEEPYWKLYSVNPSCSHRFKSSRKQSYDFFLLSL